MLAWLYLCAHLLGFVIVILAYNKWPKSQTTVETYRPKIAGTFDTCHVDYTYDAPVAVTNVNIVYALASVFLISSGFEFFYATDGFGSGAYSSVLAQGWNPFKFISNALTTSIIFVIVSLLLNTRDTGSLMTVALASMALQFVSYSSESSLRGRGLVSRNANDTVSANTLVWWILFASLWSPILFNINAQHIDNNDSGNSVIKGYQWYIIIMQMIYFASYGVIQATQFRDRLAGNSKFNFMYTENNWQSLSLFQNVSIASSVIWALLYNPRKC